ncbi:MAG: peptidase [Micromonosporaceae bacterium]|nr:peptidase [Micromonosporaceae bacterium]
MRNRRHRLAAALAGLGAAVMIGLAGAPAQAASTTEESAPAAAGWLADQLVDGTFVETEFGPSAGLTIDAVLAFAATGVAGDQAGNAMTWLATPEVLPGYVGDGEVEIYAGAHAKLALAAQVQGLDPTSFGGVDLPARLLALQDEDGRFRDQSEFGDFSNAFTQSFAVLALVRTPTGAPAEAVDFLLAEQCPGGGFPEQFGQESCSSDVDATAMVVQALLAAGADPAAALDWLAGQQQPGGGFTGAGLGANANSTGLAGQALRAAGRDAPADAAVSFLQSLQVGCDGPEEQRGAVALDDTGFDPTANVELATAQAILGMTGVAMGELDGTGAQSEAPSLRCETTPTPTPTGSAAPAPGGKGGELPVTGSPVLLLAGGGAALAGAGGLAIWGTRLRRRDSGPAAG